MTRSMAVFQATTWSRSQSGAQEEGPHAVDSRTPSFARETTSSRPVTAPSGAPDAPASSSRPLVSLFANPSNDSSSPM